MKRSFALSLLFSILLSSRALPQQLTPPTTGAIEGTVVRADNGDPVSGAQVTLNPAVIAPPVQGVIVSGGAITSTLTAPPPNGGPATVPAAPPRPPSFQPVTTGADGKFAFKDLAPGAYRVIATVNGFVRQEYGQKSLNGQGRPLFVTAGKTINDAILRMTPTGIVSGRVFDENGQPAIGAPVQILRAAYNAQGRSFQVMAVGTDSLNDLGEFRIFGLTPGRFYLVAGTSPGPVRAIGGRGVAGSVGSARYSMVFYPTAAAFEQASTIEVKGGAETSFNITVKRQTQTYRVRGRIVDGTGVGIPANTTVMLGYRTFNGGGSFSSRQNFDAATNTFEIQNVAPGDYYVQVQFQMAPPTIQNGLPVDAATSAALQATRSMTPSAQVPIHVVDADIEGVVLNVTTGVTAIGRFVVEGQPISVLPNVRQMSLLFGPTESSPLGGVTPAGTAAAEDGTFQVNGLREGEYRINLRTQAPLAASGFYIKSIQYGGEDVLTKPLKFFSNSVPATFEVTFHSGASQIAGNVTDSKSEPVAGIQVIAIPSQRGRTLDYKTAITDQNGHYSLTGITPGDYQIFSWESVDNGAYYDPEFLKRYETKGKLVHVGESSNQSVDVKLIPAQ
jgi:hypothetical protein